MRREDFFKQLGYLLQDIADEDKEEALTYYRDYLDEAGPENEERVIEEFGSPERVAAIIRADLSGNMEDGGSFTDSGYEDERFRDPNYQVAKRLDLPEERECHDDTNKNAEYKEMKKTSAPSIVKWILAAILLIVASPALLSVGGVVIGAIGILSACVIGVLLLTVAAFIVSVVLAGLGIGFLAASPMDSLVLFGIAICGVGCGLLGVALVTACFGMFLPFVVRGIWKGVQRLTGKSKEAA